ncbi:ubiquinone biosynthesis monooxygenase Coq7 [Solimonas aquatica]|uniref:3-demethoxyubiquinol 3-hydroxylase n=1 Tax=Solimonas aquatica TaxID=489703 RepID=A0A1H9CTT5_9GAMM|nr:2-polyprenyl-3-methyl-6-methoxy-1,4-benzoquinone monooxygenase [Solimonas aquatica]SEQ04497.1 ubiquinone biosynthesis monooxygenase Coq7 [Solimonas aquatica]
MKREYRPVDPLLSLLGRGLATLAGAQSSARGNPGGAQPETELDESQRRHIAGLMRVNHAGEVAAQALYQGQALTARNPATRQQLLAAAREEQDHLRWCEERLRELGDGPSKLQPLWYAGSFAIGALAGAAGDRVSLGFVDETEKQVSEHLSEHLAQLPQDDQRDRAILETMRADEERHGAQAREAGGAPLPAPVRGLMRQVARVMKFGAYRI